MARDLGMEKARHRRLSLEAGTITARPKAANISAETALAERSEITGASSATCTPGVIWWGALRAPEQRSNASRNRAAFLVQTMHALSQIEDLVDRYIGDGSAHGRAARAFTNQGGTQKGLPDS